MIDEVVLPIRVKFAALTYPTLIFPLIAVSCNVLSRDPLLGMRFEPYVRLAVENATLLRAQDHHRLGSSWAVLRCSRVSALQAAALLIPSMVRLWGLELPPMCVSWWTVVTSGRHSRRL